MADIPVFPSTGFANAGITPTASPVGSLMDFVNASTQGSEVGLKVPTVVGAIAQGITQGYETYQKASLNQAQIENYQASAAYHRAQAADTLSGQPDAKEQAELDYKKIQTQKLQSEVSGQQALAGLSDVIANGDASQVKGLLTNPSAVETLIKNSQEAPVILGLMRSKVGADPEASQMLDALTKNIQGAQFKGQKQGLDDQIRDASIKTGVTNIKKVIDDGIIHDISAGETDPAKAFSNFIAFPPGTKSTVDIDGKKYYDPNAKSVPNEDSAAPWDVFDTRTNELVRTLDPARAKAFSSARNGYSAQIEQMYRASFPEANLTGDIPQVLPQDLIYKKQQQSVPTAPQPSNQNQTIAQQTQQELNTGTIGGNQARIGSMEQLAAQKSALKQKWAAQGKTVFTPNAQPSPAITPTETPKVITAVPTPNQAISQVGAGPLKVNVPDTTPHVDPVVYSKINSDPLVRNEPAIYKGIAAVESLGNTSAVSPTGVKGLLQVTQATARQYGFNRDIPEQQLAASKAYVEDLTRQFKGNMALVFASYNAGQGTIGQAVKEVGSTDWNDLKPYLQAHVSEAKWKELHDYPERVINASAQFINPNSAVDKQYLSLLAFNNLISPDTKEV